MKSKQIEEQFFNTLNSIVRLNKIVDKLEKRISTLEKVLASHAKCIGEMREDNNEQS
jgi:exonuclease VII small subunit|tara:strand:+ start:4254 stop:4424 length:171 start_codon:yes stop_codon:yes gene_type:complete